MNEFAFNADIWERALTTTRQQRVAFTALWSRFAWHWEQHVPWHRRLLKSLWCDRRGHTHGGLVSLSRPYDAERCSVCSQVHELWIANGETVHIPALPPLRGNP